MPTSQQNKKISFYVYFIAGLVIVSVAGFFPSYFKPIIYGTLDIGPLIHIHGIIFSIWLVLILSQPILIHFRQVKWHKRVGRFAGFYSIIMVILGLLATFDMVERYTAIGMGKEIRAHSIIPLTEIGMFAIFITIAILKRNSSETHKRLILLSNLAILPAAFARLFVWIGVTNLPAIFIMMQSFLAIAVLRDFFLFKRIHPVYVWGGFSLFSIELSRIFIAETNQWLQIAIIIFGNF
jgi:hypothetical protein